MRRVPPSSKAASLNDHRQRHASQRPRRDRAGIGAQAITIAKRLREAAQRVWNGPRPSVSRFFGVKTQIVGVQ
jgi:hypothetical protein